MVAITSLVPALLLPSVITEIEAQGHSIVQVVYGGAMPVQTSLISNPGKQTQGLMPLYSVIIREHAERKIGDALTVSGNTVTVYRGEA